jgi:hypothetical protein
LDLFKTIYIILLLEGLAVHPKLCRGPLVDRDRRLAQGRPTSSRGVTTQKTVTMFDANRLRKHFNCVNSRFLRKELPWRREGPHVSVPLYIVTATDVLYFESGIPVVIVISRRQTAYTVYEIIDTTTD